MEESFQIRKRNLAKLILPDLAFWIVFIILITFGAEWDKGKVGQEIKELAIVFTPFFIAVYVHAYIFNRFFLPRMFIKYLILCILLFVVFYFITRYIYETYIPGNQSSILGGIFLFILMHTGFKYLIVAPQQSLKFKEEESRRIKAERDLQEMEAKQIKAELELLKSQINPHFLFNSLNSIYSLTLDNSKKAGDAILTLSDLLRYNLESSKNKYVTLTREFEFLENYIQMESLRLGNSCKVSLVKEGEFQNKAIAPMILIPFIENCFKHGIGADSTNNFINISILLNGNSLSLTTENRIATKRMDIQQKNTQIGIENVKRRLEMLYREKYKINISSDNNLFKVILNIEL